MKDSYEILHMLLSSTQHMAAQNNSPDIETSPYTKVLPESSDFARVAYREISYEGKRFLVQVFCLEGI